MTNGCRKGKIGEREAAKVLTQVGHRSWCRRLGQSRGWVGAGQPPDVVLDEPASEWEAAQGPEVKYRSTVSLRAAWRQAVEESAGTERVPWVLARRVGRGRRGRRAEGWVLACRAREWPVVWRLVAGEGEAVPVLPGCPMERVSNPWAALARGVTVQVWPGGDTMRVAWLDALPWPLEVG